MDRDLYHKYYLFSTYSPSVVDEPDVVIVFPSLLVVVSVEGTKQNTHDTYLIVKNNKLYSKNLESYCFSSNEQR